MPIRFRCENVRCGRLLEGPDSRVGQRIRCPECHREQPVPFRAADGLRVGEEALEVEPCEDGGYTPTLSERSRSLGFGEAPRRGRIPKRRCPHCEQPLGQDDEECPSCGESIDSDTGWEISPLRWEKPELYGALRAANEKLEAAGGCFTWALLSLLGLVACVGLQMGWFDAWLDEDLSHLRGWGVYAVILCAAGLLHWIISMIRTLATFQGLRPGLHRMFEKHKLSPYEVITQIEDDSKLDEIAKHLRKSS